MMKSSPKSRLHSSTDLAWLMEVLEVREEHIVSLALSALSPYQPGSVRPADRFEKDLKIDPEDLDDLAADIAFRARRSMDGAEQNPLYGEVKTVADIVTFFEHQPRIVEPGAAPNGGPATRLGNSGVTEGPPSVS